MYFVCRVMDEHLCAYMSVCVCVLRVCTRSIRIRFALKMLGKYTRNNGCSPFRREHKYNTTGAHAPVVCRVPGRFSVHLHLNYNAKCHVRRHSIDVSIGRTNGIEFTHSAAVTESVVAHRPSNSNLCNF